jgi:hypothetical protein
MIILFDLVRPKYNPLSICTYINIKSTGAHSNIHTLRTHRTNYAIAPSHCFRMPRKGNKGGKGWAKKKKRRAASSTASKASSPDGAAAVESAPFKVPETPSRASSVTSNTTDASSRASEFDALPAVTQPINVGRWAQQQSQRQVN